VYPKDDETPEQLAMRVQLIIANELKVKAVSRSSVEIFRARRAGEPAPKGAGLHPVGEKPKTE
jgi:hypothetical protein